GIQHQWCGFRSYDCDVIAILIDDRVDRKYAASPTAPDCQNANAVQQVNAFPPVMHNGQKHWGNIHGSPVFWKEADTAWVYAWGENSHLEAFSFGNGMLQNVENPKGSKFRPPLGMPGGMLTVSANGNNPGTGVVWAVVPLDGDANQQRGVKGIVLALDAHDVSRTLWTSEQDAQRDGLGLFAKFTPPLVTDGKVFVATYGHDEPRRTYPPGNSPTGFPKNYYVAVYGLQTGPHVRRRKHVQNAFFAAADDPWGRVGNQHRPGRTQIQIELVQELVVAGG